MEFGEI